MKRPQRINGHPQQVWLVHLDTYDTSGTRALTKYGEVLAIVMHPRQANVVRETSVAVAVCP